MWRGTILADRSRLRQARCRLPASPRLEFRRPTARPRARAAQEDAPSVTAEIETTDVDHEEADSEARGVVRPHLLTASIFLLLGALALALTTLQLLAPDFLSGAAFTTYGRLAPAGRLILEIGWLTLGLLGAGYWVLGKITGGIRWKPIALASLGVIALGVLAGAVGILLGYSSGLSGQEAPIWAKAIMAVGFVFAAIGVVATSRAKGDRLGAAGWYLTTAPMWLAASAVVGLVPHGDGVTGTIQNAFVNATFVGLFYVTASVGLLYYVFARLANSDPTETRPLAALGFWSLTIIWANLAAVQLIYAPTPDWYETIGVAFAIAALAPLVTIAGDIGLMLRGRVSEIGDRSTLRYALVASLSLAIATLGVLLWAWRGTSAIVQYSTWVSGVDALIVLGGGSFAVFAAVNVMKGGSAASRTLHQVASTVGLALIALGFLVGGVVVGFSWAAGPASQVYANAGLAWKVTLDSIEPFLWVAAAGTWIWLVAQAIFIAIVGRRPAESDLDVPPETSVFDLQFEGTPRYASWGRLVWGAAFVWVFAAIMTLALPIADDTDRDSTLLADTYRTYPDGSAEAIGRDLYISEGCVECHTQTVRPIGTDVGLGPVSIAGDYANENPALLGAARFGPDLMHYAIGGGRAEFFDAVLIQGYLANPRAVIPYSTMPSYSYLSAEDLGALVSYLETLR